MTQPDVDSDIGTGGNFWEPREYSHTVKRLENANKLCSELAAMIQERSEIEKAYAANLNKFASRVDLLLKTGLEYGTCSNLLSGLAKEAEDNASLHNSIASSLIEPVQAAIKYWQKENFHKGSISSSLKEVKLLESEFETAQKLWYKNYKHVNRCKKDYFQACRAVRSQQVQVQNAKNEPCGTSEQQEQNRKELRKMEDKLKKATKEEEKTRVAYSQAVSVLKDVTPRYVEDMTTVFNKAQGLERGRIEFFKEQALRLHDVLDVSNKPNLSKIFTDFKMTIGMADAEADLKKWSLTHGVDMVANFPIFEEYNPELNQLGGLKNRKKHSVLADGNSRVTLSGVSTITSPDKTVVSAPQQQTSNESTPAHGYSVVVEVSTKDHVPVEGSNEAEEASQENHTEVAEAKRGSSVNGGGAGTDVPPEVPPYPEIEDDGRPGVTIRALYDYTGVESDELSFVVGDVFEKLEDEDEQGWCKGRKDGRVGLYPANYVEVV